MIATILLALYLWGIIPASEAVILLAISGAALVIAEFFIVSLGVLALNGSIALFLAYSLHNGAAEIFGLPIDLGLFFGIAITELAALGLALYFLFKQRKHKSSIGVESMIDERASVVEWSKTKGHVVVQGETWQARSEEPLKLSKDDVVTVKAVEKLTLLIEPFS